MKKKSARKSVEQFRMEADEIRNYVQDFRPNTKIGFTSKQSFDSIEHLRI